MSVSSSPAPSSGSSSPLANYFAPDDGRDALRALAGLLIGLGLVMVFVRKSSSLLGEPWGDFGLFLVLLAATGFLYGVGMAARAATAEPRRWEAVYVVFGIFLVPLTLLQFVQLVNGDTSASLNITWIFLVTAVLAAYAGMNGFRYGWLLASLSAIVAWSALWNKIISGGLSDHFDTYRLLLLVVAALILGAGWALASASARDDDDGDAFSEFVTGAALAAVAAGALSFGQVAALTTGASVPSGLDSAVGWELILLVVSLAAIAYGSRAGARGPAYVGGFGLFAFLLVAGLDLNSSTPHGDLVGWPLLLIVLGLVAFVVSMRTGGASTLTKPREAAGTPAEPPPPPPPGE